mgnify:CR=1 FL=1
MDYQNSVTLIVPKTFNELVNAIAKNPSAVHFAGGTYLMSQPDYYPKDDVHSYIYLGQIPEVIDYAMSRTSFVADPQLEDIFETDAEIRMQTERLF